MTNIPKPKLAICITIIVDTENHRFIYNKTEASLKHPTFWCIMDVNFKRIYSFKVHSTCTCFFRSGKISQINYSCTAFMKNKEGSI